MIDVYRSLTQDEVRGLFTHSQNTKVASISFSKQYPTVVHVLTANGHAFDSNFGVGLKRLIEMCRDQGVNLQAEACRPVAAVTLPEPRELEEALDRQEETIHAGQAPVEAPLALEVVEGRQARAKGKTEKKTGKGKKPKARIVLGDEAA